MILLVEADAALRDLAATVLERQGYTVHRAGSSQEAVSIAGRLGRVDLLVAEAVMPEMTGEELAQWLYSSHPCMKALFASAFDEDKAAHQGILDPAAGSLRKPYTPSILSRATRAALDGGGPCAPEDVGVAPRK